MKRFDCFFVGDLKLNFWFSLQQCPFENPSIEKIFDRFKNRFSKAFTDELKEIDPLEYVDDDFRDIYQRIGVDVPAKGDNEDRGSRSRGKQKVAEDRFVFLLPSHV